MSKIHQTHLLLETQDAGVYEDTKRPKKNYVFACMETTVQIYSSASASSDREPTCPVCSKAWAAKQLKALAEAGTVLTAESETDPATILGQTYKSWKLVKLNGERIGFIGFPHGFKMNWQVFANTMADDNDTVIPLRDKYPAKRPDTCAKSGLHSMEAAMLAVPALVEAGKLKTEAQVKAERDQWLVKRSENARKYKAREAAEKTERDDVLAGLQSITQRKPGHVLTNFEIDAAHGALKLLKEFMENLGVK